MKKILVIHNKYKQEGGEDLAVKNELILLKKEYEIKELYFNNDTKNLINQIFAFLMNRNSNSMNRLLKCINEFKPDYAYVHNTWFKASLGIFKVLDSQNIKTILKLHNFRYNCTKTYLSNKHLGINNICQGCGLKKENLGFFNKYFQDSYIKSFLVNRYGKKYYRILFKSNIKILVLTEFHKKFLINLGINDKKIEVYQNFIEAALSEKENVKKDYIVYAGRISKEKGVEDLIKSFNNSFLDDLKLKIIGEGPELKYLKSKYIDDKIEFTGRLDNKDVLKIIQESKAVVTATKLYEGQPTLLCEASLMGIPSIFPRTGGVEEFFPENYQLSFEQFDYKDLEKKLSLLSDTEMLNKVSIQNKNFVNLNLNFEVLNSKFKKIINEL